MGDKGDFAILMFKIIQIEDGVATDETTLDYDPIFKAEQLEQQLAAANAERDEWKALAKHRREKNYNIIIEEKLKAANARIAEMSVHEGCLNAEIDAVCDLIDLIPEIVDNDLVSILSEIREWRDKQREGGGQGGE